MIHLGLPAYVGPGAGFAFLGSLLSLLSAAVAAVVSVVIWPFRMAWLLLVRPKGTPFARVIFLGFDGLDPAVAEKLMAEGKLPNFARLRAQGSWRRLRTTFPALSTVAWSTFATGVNPGKHGVFDSDAPEPPRFRGESFWKVLGQHGIRSTILLVPGTYPSAKFNGRELSVSGSCSDSYPRYYATYLAKLLGADSILSQREAIFFSTLEKTRRGVVACVIDTPDYCSMDRVLGQTLARMDADTALFVLSVHGLCDSRRVFNLNAWLLREGYLAREAGNRIDWARTRACACGLTGVRLNLQGREPRGIVKPEESARLKQELVAKLAGLRDDETGKTTIHSVHQASDLYHGPYLNAGPDIVIGFGEGYTASDPSLVAGVLFSNVKITADDPGIEDMAPTALRLFGIRPPSWMEGRSVVAAA